MIEPYISQPPKQKYNATVITVDGRQWRYQDVVFYRTDRLLEFASDGCRDVFPLRNVLYVSMARVQSEA